MARLPLLTALAAALLLGILTPSFADTAGALLDANDPSLLMEPLYPDAGPLSWGGGVTGVLLAGLLGVAASALRTFRRSTEFRGMGVKQRVLLDIVAVAVQIVWRRYGREAKQRAEVERRKLNRHEREKLQSTARMEIKRLARQRGLDAPEVRNDEALNGLIDLEVAQQKARRSPIMRAGRRAVESN